MKKQNIILFLLVVLLIGLCIVPFGLLLGVPIIQEWRVKRGLEIMYGADYIYEGYSVYGGSSGQRSIYYWIDRPTDEVADYYDHHVTNLMQSVDEYGTWYIGLLKGDTTTPEQTEGPYPMPSPIKRQIDQICQREWH